MNEAQFKRMKTSVGARWQTAHVLIRGVILKIMTTEKITVAQADKKMRDYGGDVFDQWNALLAIWETGDAIVEYSDVDVYEGFCSGDEGIALSRNGEIIIKIALAILA